MNSTKNDNKNNHYNMLYRLETDLLIMKKLEKKMMMTSDVSTHARHNNEVIDLFLKVTL